MSRAAALVSLDSESERRDDEGEPTISEAAARRLTRRIQAGIDSVCNLLLEAQEAQAHLVLGYGTWEEYVRGEFGMSRGESYRLVNQARVIQQLTAATGMSERVVASVVSGRQAKVLKSDPEASASEVAADVAQGVPIDDAVRAAVARRQPGRARIIPVLSREVGADDVEEAEEPDYEALAMEAALDLRPRLREWMEQVRQSLRHAPTLAREAEDVEGLPDEMHGWLLAISGIIGEDHLEVAYDLRAELYRLCVRGLPRHIRDERRTVAELAGVSAAAVDYAIGQLPQLV